MNFALILFILTVVTGALWLLDVIFLAPKRRAEAQDELRAFDIDNEEALRRGEKSVVAARNAIAIRIKERPKWLEYTAGFFPIILIIFVIRSFFFEPFRIPSGSMMPTLETGDMILVNKYKYGVRLPVLNTKILNWEEPKRGDVAVFRYPPNPEIDYIKRIVGLPGDRITYIDKKLKVNGVPVPETPAGTFYDETKLLDLNQFDERLDDVTHKILIDRTRPSSLYALPTHTDPGACEYVPGGLDCIVPKNTYFVLGDNRDNSEDSRYWGFVPEKNLVGKAFLIWLNVSKPSRIGFFE
ncbi:MAG: signal peptidase I [Burkholderiales bacterium]|nr:signal peptidase I [Burkholderiales bacterium]